MSLLRSVMRAAFPEAAWEVDLHGMRVPEALLTVAEAMEAARKAGGGRIRVICGKGRHSAGGVGVLREAVGGWLETHGHGGFARVVERDGLDGSILVEVEGETPVGGYSS